MTARQIGNETGILLKAFIDLVKRVLRNFGLVGRIAAKKPLLNKKQIQKRNHWCKSYSALSVIDWKNVIFSDESRSSVILCDVVTSDDKCISNMNPGSH